jgi:two-component system, chemotaxis family, chemotaxis protein CheY
MRILIVEDDFASRRILSRILDSYGSCEVAIDGSEAVEAVQLALEAGENYDLICLDIMMPKMNGQEALKQIRALEEQKGIAQDCGAKIIITSALSDSKNVMEAFRSHCDGYITKPYSKATISAALKKHQ